MKRIKSFKFEVSSFQWERWLGVAEFEMAAVIRRKCLKFPIIPSYSQ
jgi:hypothetical protein